MALSQQLVHGIRVFWQGRSPLFEPEAPPSIDPGPADALESELTRLRKENACRQRVGNVIARYFIKGERTPDISIAPELVKIDSNPAWVPGMLERADLTEPEFAAFRYLDRPTDTILDIGANFGYSATTIWAAGSRSMILSFEPNPWHIPCLEQIKALRGQTFDFLQIGLAASEGDIRFVMPVVEGTGISGLSSAAIESETDWAIPENVVNYMMTYVPDVALPTLQFSEVRWRVAPLDTVLRTHRFSIPLDTISAIKIDVEGFEADVIAGATATLRQHKPVLLIEGANRVPDVVSQLTDLGYLYADFDGDGVVLSEATSTRTGGFYLHGTKLEQYRGTGLLKG